MQGAVAIDYIYGGICEVPAVREMLFNAEAQRTQREAQRTHFEGGWRVHYAVSGGSASGSGCGNTRRGSPLGRKRLGWPGILPAGDGFGGVGGFRGVGSGGVRGLFALGWGCRVGSFGNLW